MKLNRRAFLLALGLAPLAKELPAAGFGLIDFDFRAAAAATANRIDQQVAANFDTGFVVRIIAGTGRGQVRSILTNELGVYSVIDPPFDPAPAADSVVIFDDSALMRRDEELIDALL